MQCKDIPDRPILEFMFDLKECSTATWFAGWDNSVTKAMPAGTPEKIVRAKMNQLMHRKLIDGCNCGCRGDYELTAKGHDYILQLRATHEAAPAV